MLNQYDVYHRLFYEEAQQQIDKIESLVLALESSQDDILLVQDLFRQAHALKGAASTLEIQSIIRIAHSLESLFELKKTAEFCFTTEVIDLILQAVDCLKRIHLSLFTEDGPVVLDESDAVIEEMEGYLKLLKPMLGPSKVADSELGHAGNPVIQIEFEPSADMLSIKAYMIIECLKSVVKMTGTQPPNYEELDDGFFQGVFFIEVEEEVPLEAIELKLSTLTGIAGVSYQKKSVDPDETNPVFTEKTESLELNHIRVQASKIDEMVDLAGEFVVVKEMLKDRIGLLYKENPKNPIYNELLEGYERLHDLSMQFRGISLDMRLVPLEVLFSKFPRIVRDLLKNSNKKIDLNIQGQSQGIDKSLIEKLTDPMTHLIRNAIDHGFESVEERLDAGKPPGGVLSISAMQGQHQMVIVVEDDGKGIDIAFIQKKAIEKGFVSIDEAAYMNDGDWMALLFAPGFSTAPKLTTVSGRGVGLDLVQSNVHQMNGHIDIESEVGKGTRFTLKLPLTLSVMNAIVLKQKNSFFGIPSSMVIEIVRLDGDEFDSKLHKTDYDQVFTWENQVMPYVSFEKKYNLKSRKRKENKKYLVVVGVGETKFVIDVDEVVGESELVVKPVNHLVGEGRILGRRYDLLGMSILGDGNIVQIVDVSQLL